MENNKGDKGEAVKNQQYFHPTRTQPFIITFFQAVMAFKRVSKMMKRRMFKNKSKNTRRLSTFKMEMIKSNKSIAAAAKGKPVITMNIVQNESPFARSLSPGLLKEIDKSNGRCSPSKGNVVNEKLMIAVARKVEDFYSQVRNGKTLSVSEKLQKHLIGSQELLAKNELHKKTHGRRRAAAASLIPANDVGSLLLKNDNFQLLSAALGDDGHQQGDEESQASAREMEYLPGTSIYFGATVSIQARHGGFLSYNSNSLKASAHKIMSHTCFVVKNSEDLTDIGIMKYGDALWLQAGHHEVLGAQYSSLVDQKREIQPSLISCKRQSMFKAQQYGRWIVLNREDPMGTMGQPVLHLDSIILEQEWYFLASYSPYESNMYKWPGNANDIYDSNAKQDISSLASDLFRPSEECSWKVHLVALPSEEKEDERQRQLLLQHAKDQIDTSEAGRWQKSQNLLGSLANGLSKKLTDDAIMTDTLKHKRTVVSNQANLLKLYKTLEANGFESRIDPAKLLINVYGEASPIVLLKNQELKVKEHEHNFVHFHTTKVVNEDLRSGLQRADDNYWAVAQKLLINTKGWSELSAVMNEYYKIDVGKKISAALTLQRCVRRYINSKFDYERSMKRVDKQAAARLQEKMIARRKMLFEHAATIDLLQKAGNSVASGIEAPSGSPGGNGANSRNSSPLGRTRKRLQTPAGRSGSISGGGAQNSDAKQQSDVFITASDKIGGRGRSSSRADSLLAADISSAAVAATHAVMARPYSAQVSQAMPLLERRSSSRVLLPLSRSDSSFHIVTHNGVTTKQERSASFDKSSRPQTAGSKVDRTHRHDADSRRRSASEALYTKLFHTMNTELGLPADVFEDPQFDVGTRTGLKFLKAMSTNPKIYGDITTVRRKTWTGKGRRK